MFLKSLKLTNFRNYPKAEFEFGENITVLVGNNAQGKSNFLESIFFLATAKSSKADRDEELIRYKEEVLRVEGELENEIKLEVVMQLSENWLKKRVSVNGVPRRVLDYAANLAVILFSPEDLNMVTGSPSLRRNHIDSVLSQVDRSYKKNLSSYENIVIRKNRLLKSIREGTSKVSELDYWSDQQILLGNLLTTKRAEFFEFVNKAEKKLGEFSFEYLPSPISLAKLKSYVQKEIDSANSLIGPHRDDFCFKLNGQDLSKYGSRGEQRTAILDLKLTEVNFMEQALGDRPVLLLDDIFSELDEQHRQHVIDFSSLQQTIIATVDWDDYLKSSLKDAAIIYVENGQLSGRVGKLSKLPKVSPRSHKIV